MLDKLIKDLQQLRDNLFGQTSEPTPSPILSGGPNSAQPSSMADFRRLESSSPIDPPSLPSSYTVQPGDNLWDITEKVNGDPTLWPKLYQENKQIIGNNPNLIFKNQNLNLGAILPKLPPRLDLPSKSLLPFGQSGIPSTTSNSTQQPMLGPNSQLLPHNPSILDKIGSFVSDLKSGVLPGAAESIPGTAGNKLMDKVWQKSYENAQQKGQLPYGIPKVDNTPFVPQNTAQGIGKFIGSNIADLPAWLGGEALLARPLGALAESAPVLKAADSVPNLLRPLARTLAPALGTGIKAGTTFGGVIAPLESLANGDNLNQFLQREKQVPAMALGGSLLHGGGQLLGKGINEAGNALADRRLGQLTQPLLNDVQNAFKAPSLQDFKTSELQKNSVKYNLGVDQTPGVNNLTSPLERNAKQGDLQKLFSSLPNQNKYSFTTGEQRAMSDLQDGVQAVQNYIGHTDVLAAFPSGTSVEQAYSTIAKDTGVDLPKLMSNWEKAQAARNTLTPEQRIMGKTAGVLPDLAPRKSWTQLVQQEVIDPPQSQPLKLPPQTWTNKQGILPSPLSGGPNLPLRPGESPLGLPSLRQRQPQLPLPLGPAPTLGENGRMSGGPLLPGGPLAQSKLPQLPLGSGRVEPLLPQKLTSPLAENMKMVEASSHPVAEHIMSKLDDFEAAARARIASNRGRLNAGLPVDTMVDYSIIGAVKIARGTVKYSVWANDMLSDLGSSVRPHLKDIWEESNRQHSLMVDGTFSTALPEPQSKIIIGKQKEPFSFNNAWNKFYTGVVNTQQPISNAAKVAGSDMGKLASNTKNVSGIVDHNFLRAMVDKDGNKVGESLKSTVETIPKGQEEEFWTYMSQRHNIDRAREESHQAPKIDKQGFLVKDKDRNQVYETVVTKKATPVQANYTPNMSAQAVKNAEQAHPEYKGIGDGITKWIDNFMQTWGVDTGIVDKDIYKGLRETYKSYFPTQRDFSTLEKAIPDNVSQKFSDQRTPIRKATGSERDIVDPIENIMQLVNRTVRTAKYNEVGQSLLTAVKENPTKMKQFAEVMPTKDGMFANTDNVISVLVDGKPTYLKINDKMLLDSMNGLPKSIGNIPVLSTLTNGFKNLITQKNPLFAVRNIFRDVPTAYVYGSEPNPFKFGAGLIGAGKDILTNGPRLQKYQGVGGGGANFFNSGDVTKSAAELMGNGNKLKSALAAPIHAIEKFNNLTETAPRLAEFNRVLDKTGDVTKALFAANDVTVNFSRGGNLTKNVDRGVPYLSAGVQGLDKFFRGFANPKTALSTIIKSGVAITAPDLALYMVNKDDPNYQALDNRTKDSNFLIPKGDGTFIKIPKSRELGVLFGSLFERGLRAAEGQKDSFKGFGNTLATSFAPANPIDSNFFAPATWNIATNKDFADRAIVPQGMLMDKRPKYLQYDEKTTSIAKAIGELSTKVIPGGISPKQLDYLVKSYSGVIGQFGAPLATPGGSPGKTLTSQFMADPAFSNQSATDFYDKLDKLSSAATSKNILQKLPSKNLTPEEAMRNSMTEVSTALSRGTKLINNLQASSDPAKEDKIRAIKIRMLDLTKKANSANSSSSMQSVGNSSKNMFKK